MKKVLFKKHNKGFTLVELMIALFILATVIGVIFYSYYASIESANTSRNVSLALGVAKAKMEQIRHYSFQDIYDWDEYVFPPDPIDITKDDIEYEDMTYRGVVYVDNEAGELVSVTVVVGWRQGERVIGDEWLMENNPDPAAHAQATSPVVLQTFFTNR